MVMIVLITVAFVGEQMEEVPESDADTVKLAVTKSVISIAFIGLFFTAYIIIFQSITTTKINKNIFENFNKIAEMSYNKTFYKIDYRKFKKQFIIKVILITVGYILPFVFSQVLKYMEIAPGNTAANVAYSTLPILIVKCATFKFIFYADLINFHLLTIERLLKRPYIPTVTISEILDNFNVNNNHKHLRTKHENLIEKILIAKKMYGSVWRNTCLVNECLGWTLLMIFVLLTIGLIVLLYLAYIFVAEKADLNMYTGKKLVEEILLILKKSHFRFTLSVHFLGNYFVCNTKRCSALHRHCEYKTFYCSGT